MDLIYWKVGYWSSFTERFTVTGQNTPIQNPFILVQHFLRALLYFLLFLKHDYIIRYRISVNCFPPLNSFIPWTVSKTKIQFIGKKNEICSNYLNFLQFQIQKIIVSVKIISRNTVPYYFHSHFSLFKNKISLLQQLNWFYKTGRICMDYWKHGQFRVCTVLKINNSFYIIIFQKKCFRRYLVW